VKESCIWILKIRNHILNTGSEATKEIIVACKTCLLWLKNRSGKGTHTDQSILAPKKMLKKLEKFEQQLFEDFLNYSWGGLPSFATIHELWGETKIQSSGLSTLVLVCHEGSQAMSWELPSILNSLWLQNLNSPTHKEFTATMISPKAYILQYY